MQKGACVGVAVTVDAEESDGEALLDEEDDTVPAAGRPSSRAVVQKRGTRREGEKRGRGSRRGKVAGNIAAHA